MQILFLSDHDLVRGPMARVLCQKHASDMRVLGASFDSAGIAVAKPHHPKPEVLEFMRGQQLNIGRHTSKPLLSPQLRSADVILCMTGVIADTARQNSGPSFAGKILVLNDVIGFGNTPHEIDIQSPRNVSHGALLAVYSRLKASTGRLVRMMSEGLDTPEDFGVTVAVTSARDTDNPQVRQFLARYILEFIERAFEPPTSEQIREALEAAGRIISILEIEELLRHDLAGDVTRNRDRWHMKEKTRAREEEKKAKKEEKARAAAPPPEPAKLTIPEALKLLTITLQTPKGEAQKTYRKLLMRYHPDKFHDDASFRELAEEKARRINIAWELVQEKLPD